MNVPHDTKFWRFTRDRNLTDITYIGECLRHIEFSLYNWTRIFWLIKIILPNSPSLAGPDTILYIALSLTL